MQIDELISMMKADLDNLAGFFPELVIVWSEIVPRVVWQEARDLGTVEGVRRSFNTHMARCVRHKGGVVVRPRQLEEDNRRLMRPVGVPLINIGLYIFLSSLQDRIEQALLLLDGGQRAVCRGYLRSLWWYG